jgi:hypothetical protein
MRYPVRPLALVLPFFVALAVPSCGWRTALDEGGGGGDPRDAGPADARPSDGSTDVPRRDTGGTCGTSADCDDGLVCNGIEACVDGRCVSTRPVECIDGIECTRDRCVEPVGCVFEPDDVVCGPGARCDGVAGCVPSGGCLRDEDCFDGDACNGDDRCDPGGFCVSGPSPSCEDDGIFCTVESCDPIVGCVSIADSTLCGAGELCRVAAGGCVRVPCMSDAECSDLDPCNGEETCNRTTGICQPGRPPTCDDGVPCTLDSCIPGSGCFTTTSPERCFDGVDNDCNGAADCGDPVCAARPECGGCIPTSPSERGCFDFLDDDCDGFFDCTDPDCAMAPECRCVPVADAERACADFVDDDCDGQPDCLDPDCVRSPECGGCASSEFDCADFVDDDCDGQLDCRDSDCAFDVACRTCTPTGMTETSCDDTRDDDCDGLVDCEDPDCARIPGCACVPRSMTEGFCRDGVDDDCDGLLDCRDPDCASRPFCTSTCTPVAANEIGVATCTNGRDDDCDGRPDCGDPDCAPFGPMSECCNGRDDNGDGFVDEFTCYCESNDDCATVGTLAQVCWLNTFSICAPDCRRVGSDSYCAMFFADLPRCNRSTGECGPR